MADAEPVSVAHALGEPGDGDLLRMADIDDLSDRGRFRDELAGARPRRRRRA